MSLSRVECLENIQASDLCQFMTSFCCAVPGDMVKDVLANSTQVHCSACSRVIIRIGSFAWPLRLRRQCWDHLVVPTTWRRSLECRELSSQTLCFGVLKRSA